MTELPDDRSLVDALRKRIAELETSHSREVRAQDALRGALYSADITFFDYLSLELAQAVGADFAFVGALLPDARSVRAVGMCAEGKVVPGFEYALEHTPCADVMGKDLCFFPKGITSLYPKDQLLVDMRIEGYCGVPLFDTMRRAIGLIVVLSRRPLENSRRVESLLRLAAVRASAELERSQSQSRLRSIFDSNMMGIVFWNSNGAISQANDAFLRTVRYTREDLESGKVRWREMTPPEHAAQDEKGLGELEAGGTCLPYEKEFVCKDGTRVSVLIGGARMTKEPLTGVAYVMDLSALKVAQRAARSSDELNRHVISSIREGLAVHDRELRYVHFNHKLEEITGLPAKDVIGRHPLEVFPQLKEMGLYDDLERALRGDAQASRELPYRSRDTGLVRWTSTSIYPMRDAAAVITGVIAVVRDITEIKNIEEALRDSERLLSDALRRTEDRVVQLEEQVQSRSSFEGMVGKSPAMQDIYRRLRLAAESDVTVLVTGESGTGKELAAASVHSLSHRRDRPFVAVNCSAIPEGVLESELFGHVKGAFTGAIRDKVGLFQAAEGGTLFLDEVGDMSPVLQVKVLRALQEREIRRVGDDRQLKVNVRVVTATNRDLAGLIAKGTLREDFYYRIRVFEIRLPSLRERREDLPPLVEYFVREFSEALRRPVQGVSPEALRRLMEYDWPGNVRELRNAIEHAFVTTRGDTLALKDFPPELRVTAGPARTPSRTATTPSPKDQEECDRIVEALRRTGGNRTKAARTLGISRVTLWNRMNRYGIES